MRRKRRWKWRILLILLILLASFIALRIRLGPIMEELACAQVASVLSDLINDAVSEELAEHEIEYESIITFQKNEQGGITALQTNMARVNALRTETVQCINDRTDSMPIDQLGVPLGNLAFPELFAGRGPKIPIRLIAVADSDAQFYNDFSAAGINQTLHRIILRVELTATILTPTGMCTVKASGDVIVAETVIVGYVPDSFTNIGLDR